MAQARACSPIRSLRRCTPSLATPRAAWSRRSTISHRPPAWPCCRAAARRPTLPSRPSAVLAVTTPHICGMGGDLFALVHNDESPAPVALERVGTSRQRRRSGGAAPRGSPGHALRRRPPRRARTGLRRRLARAARTLRPPAAVRSARAGDGVRGQRVSRPHLCSRAWPGNCAGLPGPRTSSAKAVCTTATSCAGPAYGAVAAGDRGGRVARASTRASSATVCSRSATVSTSPLTSRTRSPIGSIRCESDVLGPRRVDDPAELAGLPHVARRLDRRARLALPDSTPTTTRGRTSSSKRLGPGRDRPDAVRRRRRVVAARCRRGAPPLAGSTRTVRAARVTGRARATPSTCARSTPTAWACR